MQENAQALRRLQGDALRMLMLACAFIIFFAASKHLPAWSKINPFADDPADAVASIAIQAAIFLATLSCIRAFRERSAGIAVDARAIVCAMDGAAAWTRRYWWIFIVAAGMTIGAFLASRELTDAHSAFSRTAFVVSVYSGLESGAVLIGALLLSHPLALSRKTTEAAP